ncbi:MAG: CopG family transcriptional regulator [Actinobacteria bacterium]|nr:CopG family transcriptional regulator [Actinomycetota bacterium]
MANKLDPETARAAREDARRLEEQSTSNGPYPAGTRVGRPNQPSRMFNVRLTEEQFAAIQDLAEQRHLPMSTMARAWLLDRLDREKHAS